MVLINLGDSQDSMDSSGAGELLMGGLVMERSQSSASSYESNPEPPAPLRQQQQGRQRANRPPFRTQLSEPNWRGPTGGGTASPLQLLQHQRSIIASPDSELSSSGGGATSGVGPADSNGTLLFAPDHFRHEPFSVFYGTGAGTTVLAAAATTTATPPFCCGGPAAAGGQLAPIEAANLERRQSAATEDSSSSKQQQQKPWPQLDDLEAVTTRRGPFIFSPGASALLTRLFQQRVPADVRDQLLADMLQTYTARFDKNRRSSLAPAQAGDCGGGGSASGAGGGFGAGAGFGGGGGASGNQLSPYGPDSLFFCIGQAGSRKNSYAGFGPPQGGGGIGIGGGGIGIGGGGAGQQQENAAGGGGGWTAAAAEQQKGGQKQQKRRRAVITVDARSKEILIASDSVCRLFGFRDRSLIGKQLGQVFPVARQPVDLPEDARGPLLLQNVFFADPDQRQLKAVYGKPVDILDADGRRLTLSVWAYPLAGSSSAPAVAPRKNSAVLLRSPSAFLPSFLPPFLPPNSCQATTTKAAAAAAATGTTATSPCAGPMSPTSAASAGPFAFGGPPLASLSEQQETTATATNNQAPVTATASWAETEVDSSSTVSPRQSHCHDNHICDSSSSKNDNSSNCSLLCNNRNENTTNIDFLLPAVPTQRATSKPGTSSSASTPPNSAASTSSANATTAGYAPQLKEVLEEEQQQQSSAGNNTCEQPSSKPSSFSLDQQKSSAAAQQQQQQQHQNHQANRSIAANPFAVELNEPARRVESHPPNTAASAAAEQQQQPRSTSAAETSTAAATTAAASPSAAATPKVAPQAAQMVQAGVQLRNAVAAGGKDSVGGGKDSSGRDEDTAGDVEDAVGAALVIIPISRAEMEAAAAATQAAAEPQQQKGFLRRQYHCEIFPNASALHHHQQQQQAHQQQQQPAQLQQMAIGTAPAAGERNKSVVGGGGAGICEQPAVGMALIANGHGGHYHHHHQLLMQQKNGGGHGQQQQQQPSTNGGGGTTGNDRWLLLMEPLNALNAACVLGPKGRIFSVDDAFPAVAAILGYESTSRLLGTEIQHLIPSLHIGAEWEAREQLCCGSTAKHNGIPLTVTVKPAQDQESGTIFSYDVRIRSLASINGVVMLNELGTLHSYNENLFHELLGMEMEEEAAGNNKSKLHITDVIPHFFEYLEVAHFHMCRHRMEKQQQQQQQQQNGSPQQNGLPQQNGGHHEPSKESSQNGHHHQQHNRQPSTSAEPPPGCSPSFMPTVSHSSSCLFTQELATARRALMGRRRSNSFYGMMAKTQQQPKAAEEKKGEEEQEDDDEPQAGPSQKPEIIPGIFYGLARHVDGMMIPVKIEVSSVENGANANSNNLFAVCIGFDRSLDWGISQLSEAEEEQQQQREEQLSKLQLQHQTQHSSSTSSLMSNGGGGGAVPTGMVSARSLPKKPNFCGVSSSGTLLDAAAATGSIHIGAAAPRFSIGGRDCDSDSAAAFDFVVGGSFPAGSIITDDLLLHSAEAKMQELDVSRLEDENSEAVCGEYSKHYDTFQLIGNGAFGSVKLAARKDSGLLAVSKFICKAKVLPESWVPSPKRTGRMVPIEVHLLENLHHPNIVRVLDVFENDKYWQLVMEKCGCGMDLFEFIDHQPKLDEPLISYIFRQIVSAVDYLHQNHIVHRDLKDENVIIDQSFCCKLIDFGSAAFFGEGIVFSTFCGTMEYCSPEVLTGNKYLGPELEMWSLGILLYTLVFFENPFRSAQETVMGEVELPWSISEGLFGVLNCLLTPNPKLRATVSEVKHHWWLNQQVDPRRYNFKELLKNCERAQVQPPLYVSDLHKHLKNASSAVSCSNLVGVSAFTSALNAADAVAAAAVTGGPKAGSGGPGTQDGGQKQPQQMGIVSAR